MLAYRSPRTWLRRTSSLLCLDSWILETWTLTSSQRLAQLELMMDRSEMEQSLHHRVSQDMEGGDVVFQHDRKSSGESEASSLASLLDDGTGPGAEGRLQPFDTPESPLDPQKWSRRKKMFVAISIAFYTSAFYSGSSIFMQSVPGAMGQYGISQETALMGLSLYVLSYGLGPLLWAPLSEVRWIGRNPVYIFTILAFVAVSFGTALVTLKSLFWFLVLRFVQGFVGSPCLANGGASMHDIFDEFELPYALGVWIAFAYAGPALGPALAAQATEAYGWQFPMWFIAYASVPACILLLLLPETYLPKIIYKNRGNYSRIGEEDGLAQNLPGHFHLAHGDSILETLKDSLIKPIEISLLDPSVTFVNLYTSFCYATYYTFFDALPITYITKYGFSLSQVAQACSCIMLGCAAGAASYFAYVYYVANPRARRAPVPQEERLKPALVAVCLIPIGILIFAFASNGEIHWLVGMTGIAIYSGAVYIILQCLSMYMLKSYPQYAASLFAGNDACRSVLAAGAVHVGVPFYSNLGVVWGCSILAAISVAGIIGMWVLYWKGADLRARSKFAAR